MYYVVDQSSKLKYIFREARFFVIKSNNYENVALAKAKGVWSTPPQNEAKLNQAFRVSRKKLFEKANLFEKTHVSVYILMCLPFYNRSAEMSY